MRLDDAIVYYSETAKECRRKARIESNDYMDMKDSAYEAEQLADWLNELKVLRERIDVQPTIEERKTGKWIEYDSDEDKYDVIKCSCCKHTFTVDAYHWTDIGFVKDDFKFCPNCGAKMS